ncbi:MAG: hypothetical protein WCI66_03125, partial [Gammaproteobacteria bacterium]
PQAAPPGPPQPAAERQSFGRPPIRSSRPRVEWSPCMRMVHLLIRKPDIIAAVPIPDDLGEIRSDDMDLLLKVIEIAQAWPDSNTGELMSRIYATSYGSQLTELFGKELITPTAGMLEEFKDILQRLLAQYHARKARHSMMEQLRQLHPQAEPGAPGQPSDTQVVK